MLFIHPHMIKFFCFVLFFLFYDVCFEHIQHYKKDDNQRTQTFYIRKLL